MHEEAAYYIDPHVDVVILWTPCISCACVYLNCCNISLEITNNISQKKKNQLKSV